MNPQTAAKQTKRGISGIFVALALITIAAISVPVIWQITSRATDNAEQQLYQAESGVKIMASPELCSNGTIVAVLQNGIKGKDLNEQITTKVQAYQISNDIDERKWNADFTGDGRADKIIRRLTRDQETALRTASLPTLHHQNAGIVIWNTDTDNTVHSFFNNSHDAAAGTYDSILFILTDIKDANSDGYFHISWGATNNGGTPTATEPNMRIQKHPATTGNTYEYFGFRYAIKANHQKNCWTLERVTNEVVTASTTTAPPSPKQSDTLTVTAPGDIATATYNWIRQTNGQGVPCSLSPNVSFAGRVITVQIPRIDASASCFTDRPQDIAILVTYSDGTPTGNINIPIPSDMIDN